MKYIFLNPQSCSGLALKKWSKLKPLLSDFSKAIVVDDFYKMDWGNLNIQAGDSFISAGGDGTLHCMVNALIKHKGIAVLNTIKIGHIGLGSNNSFLRPYSDCQVVADIPMKISDTTYMQDLMQVELINNGKSETVYCVANASLGFLATANILFNTSPDIAVLKKWNSDLADIFTFLKALFKWRSINISYSTGNSQMQPAYITNMHFMKKAFYATDLGFPEPIASDDGFFRLNVLWKKGRLVILKKFFSMMVFKDLLQGRDITESVSEVNVKSHDIIPLEMDGEIYYGAEFKITTYKKGIQLCK